jgi:hypothetical protein
MNGILSRAHGETIGLFEQMSHVGRREGKNQGYHSI